MVQIHDKQFDVCITNEEIQAKVKSLSLELNKAYKGRSVLFIVVLNGSFMFASDLLKGINLENEISFVKLRSYNDFSSLGNVLELIGLNIEVEKKEVIVIEDIVDTGLTISTLIDNLTAKKARSIKVCSLLFKPNAFKGTAKPEFIGFQIPNDFVVGYGMDYNERGRNLQDIYKLKA